MNIKKGGLGPRGTKALEKAKEAWLSEPAPLYKKNPTQALKSFISNTVFATLENKGGLVTAFIERQKELLNESKSSKISIALGGQFSNSSKIGDDSFLEMVQTHLISEEDSNKNRKVWKNLVQILDKAFVGCEVTSTLNVPQADIREIIIEEK